MADAGKSAQLGGKESVSRPLGSVSQMNELILLRVHGGLTQRQLGKRLGLAECTVHRYESGKRPTPAWYVYALRYIAEHPFL